MNNTERSEIMARNIAQFMKACKLTDILIVAGTDDGKAVVVARLDPVNPNKEVECTSKAIIQVYTHLATNSKEIIIVNKNS
jgi:hypothetical protein